MKKKSLTAQHPFTGTATKLVFLISGESKPCPNPQTKDKGFGFSPACLAYASLCLRLFMLSAGIYPIYKYKNI